MATKNSNHRAQGDTSVGLLPIVVFAVLFFALLWLFWSRFHTEIATAYSWVRMVEFGPFVVLNTWVSAGLSIGLIGFGAVTMFRHGRTAKYGLLSLVSGLLMLIAYVVGGIYEGWFTFFLHSKKSLIEWDHMADSTLVANILLLSVVTIPFSVWMVRRSIVTNPMNEHNFAKSKDYTLDTYTDQMGLHYPHLRLFRMLDLSTKSINKGKYRMADTEKQLAIQHKLLDQGKPGEYVVNADRAAEYFRNTLGKPWTGYKNLTKTEFAVIASLVPRIAATDLDMPEADYKEAVALTDDLLEGYWEDAANSYSAQTDKVKINLTDAIAAVRKYSQSKKVKALIARHAYVYTVICGMLIEARRLGVLQPAEFRWLRVANRRLWLVVDNAGRGGAFGEVGGVFSHFKVEDRRKRAIERPNVSAAVKGLREAVESFKFNEEELTELTKQFAKKEDPATIDPAKGGKPKPMLFMMPIWNLASTGNDLFEIAIISGTGDILLNQRCRLPSPPSAELIANCQLSAADLAANTGLPDAAATMAKILEICNAHEVVTYDLAAIDGVKGLERSAKQIVYCKPEGAMSLASAVEMDEVKVDGKHPDLISALVSAKACRELYILQRKTKLEAEVKEAKK